jgi:Reverse transcriptase (RNA-dependent DNA polymerase)
MGIKDEQTQETIFSAEELNAHYSSVNSHPTPPNLARTTPTFSTQNIAQISNDPNSETFSFRNVDIIEVKNAIFGIKSSAIGLDGISLRFVKMILPSILPCITHIFNTVLTTSTFPNTWKISKIIPIAKIKNPSVPGDYRPISILPSLSKALEILMKEQIMNFVIQNSLLNHLQSGFRSAHSTNTALLKVTDDVQKACERRLVTVLLLLDFSKAFDSVIHDLLCSKLSNNFRFHSTAVALIRSYLADRLQSVCVGEQVSDFAPITRGVVQGSILGPILFSLFINDLLDVVIFSEAHLYADDVQIYANGHPSEITRVIEKLNADASSIGHWAQQNGLCLNPQKSQALIIGTKSSTFSLYPPIILNGCVVPYVEKVKNLGLVINSDFNWKDHVSSIIQKVYSTLRRLWSSADLIPTPVKLKLIVALIVRFL